MTWTLVGYFPKRRTPRPDWMLPWSTTPDMADLHSKPIEEICSVSDCVAPGPEGWRELKRHNFYDMYDTPGVGWSVVPDVERSDFQMFAYRLFLVEFQTGREESMEDWSEPSVEPISGSFVRLGWDAVVGGNHQGFGCSPLSCNSGFAPVRVAKKNRYCLMDTEEEAIELARHFAICQPEPGPYCVLEVWRDTNPCPDSNTAFA